MGRLRCICTILKSILGIPYFLQIYVCLNAPNLSFFISCSTIEMTHGSHLTHFLSIPDGEKGVHYACIYPMLFLNNVYVL